LETVRSSNGVLESLSKEKPSQTGITNYLGITPQRFRQNYRL